MSASDEADWPVKYPWSLLPRGGSRPFVPRKGNWLANPIKGDRFGYMDADGNEWVPAHSDDPNAFHWDVQHKDGKHSNVGPDGEIHHGLDNFE